jgi:5'(3')-deoxyribonucleotidase
MRVLLDVDGVLADFPSAALRYINGVGPLPFPVTLNDVTEHDILDCLGLSALQERFDRWCAEVELCRNLPVYPGAQDFVLSLRTFAEVVIVTSPYSAVPNWCHQRIEWLKEHFGIEKRDVIFAKRKELVMGDILIDDKAANVDAFLQAPTKGSAVVFDQPWNRRCDIPAHYRARGYAEALKAVQRHLALEG